MQRMPGARASWPSQDDNAGFYFIVVLLGATVLAYVLWLNFHGTISAGVMAVRHAEIGVIRHFSARFDLADRRMQATDPDAVSLNDLYGISRAVGMFFRIPAIGLLLVLSAICMLRAAPGRFRRSFDLEGLIVEQARSFPTAAAFVPRRLRLAPIAPKAPLPADYALTAREWLAIHCLDADGAFVEDAARAALAHQLGPVWTSIEDASPVVRCLLAACALHLAQQREAAVALLGVVSAALAEAKDADPARGPEQPLAVPAAALAAADRVLADPAVTGPALAVMQGHGFAHTGLMSLLNAARISAGVLAPGQFAWLKLVDRPLWYALHSLGFDGDAGDAYLHPPSRAEAIGARDHWAVERMVGRPVREPSLDRALAALRRAAGQAVSPVRA